MTLTCRSTASWRIEGIDWPSVQSPTAIRCLICSMIWRYIGRLSDCEIAKALLILCAQYVCPLDILSIYRIRDSSRAECKNNARRYTEHGVSGASVSADRAEPTGE